MARKIQFLILFCIATLHSASIAQVANPAPYSSNSKVNFVRTWTAAAPEISPAVLISRPLKDANQLTQYLDGMGRPLQLVVKKGSLTTGGVATDLVIPVVYDSNGRISYEYLPFAANNVGGNTSINDGLFKFNPFQQDSVFNKGQFTGETYYYSKTNFEHSPLNRVVETYAPGNSWAGSEQHVNPGIRRNISSQYLCNKDSDSVRIWEISTTNEVITSATFAVGTLFKNIIIDEHKQQTVEYVDKDGKLILKKVQISPSPTTGHTGWLCTYYVYDSRDNLRLIIQPNGVDLLLAGSWSLTTQILNEFCFRYEYDERNRMVVKKIPGSGEVWMVYDGRDRLILTQDSMLRASSPKKWLYTLYDNLNRPVSTGLWNNTDERAYHKTQAHNNAAYPNLSGQTYEELTATYYDNYNWASALPAALTSIETAHANSYFQNTSNSTWPYPQAVQSSAMTQGLVTGSKVKVLYSSPAQSLYTLHFYDEKGRLIQARSQNITGGVDIVTTQYSWNGQPLVMVQKQDKAGANAQSHIVVSNFTYDSLWRILAIRKTVNSNINGINISKPELLTVRNEYNSLGQLSKKMLGTPIIDSMRYEYNIRGWILGVNRAYAKDVHQNNYFGYDLGYDKIDNGLVGNLSYTAAQYNGNIAGTVWKSKGDGEKRKYDFGYDGANRLMKASFTQYTSSNFNLNAGLDFTLKDMSYDANGNILSMSQRGWKLGGSTTIDSLLYTYNNSNRLKNVLDRSNDVQTKLGDFRSSKLYITALSNNKTNAAVDYAYDGNGNLVKDRNKDIGDVANNGITYNYLDLPSLITVRDSGGAIKGNITYVYDAVGKKLSKTVSEVGQSAKTTLYLGDAVYLNDTLQFIEQEEGRLRYTKQYFQNGSNQYKYYFDYYVRDQLENLRVVLTEQQDTAMYLATMEAAYRAKEKALFANIAESTFPRSSVPGGYPTDEITNPNDSLARVNGSGRKVGPSLVLKVMSGDKVDMAVKSFYRGSGAAGANSDPLNDILSTLAGGIVGVAGESKGTLTQLNSAGTSPLVGAINSFKNVRDTTSTTKPRAYLNWMLLDEQLNFVSTSSGALIVGNADVLNSLVPAQLNISKNGFLYIYVSNETQNKDVFFDNFIVRHYTGPLTEETHYYPFGLKIEGISSKAFKMPYPNNKKGFNGNELQSEEFNDGSGLELYDFNARTYDPQIGRFLQIDPETEEGEQKSWTPFHFSFNRPVVLNDPDGRNPLPAIAIGLYRLYRIFRPARVLLQVTPKLPVQSAPVKMVITTDVLGDVTAVRENEYLIHLVRTEKERAMMELHDKEQKSTDASKTSNAGSRAGKNFSPKEKEKVIEANKKKNDGKTVCENCGVNTTKPEKSKKGVTPPKTDTQVDHKYPKSKGGSGTAENGQVLCRGCNRQKSNN